MSKRARRRRNASDPRTADAADSAPPRPIPGLPPAPTTSAELAAVVKQLFALDVPSRRVCRGHMAPMDYLAASFFGQRDLLVWANRGGGKTMLAAIATLLDALYHGPVSVRVLGGSFDQSDRLADHIRNLLEAHPDWIAGRPSLKRVRLTDGSDIRMLAQSQRAVRGQHVQKMRCDEVELFDAHVWRAVQFVTRSAGAARGSIEVFSTLHRAGGLMERLVGESSRRAAAEPGAATAASDSAGPAANAAPPNGFDLVRWCLWEVIERCPPSRRCDECPLTDDCRGAAREGEGFFPIDDAIAIKARSSRQSWEAEMLCRGPRRDWLVFNEFNRAAHVVPVERHANWPSYRAVDFGYQNPLVCLWIQVSPGGVVQVFDEHAQSRMTLDQHARIIASRHEGPCEGTYVDPAGNRRESISGKACVEILAAHGVPCVSRHSTIAEGLELIRAALAPAAGAPRLAVHPRCEQLIAAFEAYHYPAPTAKGSADESPVKDGPDHFIDALRYFFVNRMHPRGGAKMGDY